MNSHQCWLLHTQKLNTAIQVLKSFLTVIEYAWCGLTSTKGTRPKRLTSAYFYGTAKFTNYRGRVANALLKLETRRGWRNLPEAADLVMSLVQEGMLAAYRPVCFDSGGAKMVDTNH